MKADKMRGRAAKHTRDPIANLPAESQRLAHKAEQPAWVAPMLATLVAEVFTDDDWIFETKLDGVRRVVIRDGSDIRLLSRKKIELTEAYPELVEPLEAQEARNYIVDGEIVTFKGNVTSFARLQKRMQVRNPTEALRRGVEVFYYIFDLPYLNGYDLRPVPLIYRRELLKRNFTFRDPLRFSEHRRRDGEALFREACKKGLECLIGKRADSAYASVRSRDWLKFRCSERQEVVIVGYTEPKGQRHGLGAVLVGYYEGDRLQCAGIVGTGFDTKMLYSLGRQLSALEVERPPIADSVRGKGVHWVKPKLVAQVAFTEWTRDGHPRFLGIRHDKTPHEVVRERGK